jgi:hypothetical protein
MDWGAFISAAILFAASVGFYHAARAERNAAFADRQQAAEDFETVRKALTLFNMGAKEEAVQVLGILGERPDRPKVGTTAREFIDGFGPFPQWKFKPVDRGAARGRL